jgi:hypothetical protein
VVEPAEDSEPADGVDAVPPFLRRPAFLRFDDPELHDGCFVIRAVPPGVREGRRHGAGTPLGYLYEVTDGEPEQDMRLAAGHFDAANLVWSFSAEVTGITGITEPFSAFSPDGPARETPAQPVEKGFTCRTSSPALPCPPRGPS